MPGREQKPFQQVPKCKKGTGVYPQMAQAQSTRRSPYANKAPQPHPTRPTGRAPVPVLSVPLLEVH